MSNQDKTDSNDVFAATGANEATDEGFGAFASPQDQPAGRDAATVPDAELICQAEDLKSLLQQIANQIANSDKRHSQSLKDMHERLELIGGQAQRVKADVPDEFRPAFERIEDAVSLLADRIALADSQRQARLAPPALAAPEPETASISALFASMRQVPLAPPIEPVDESTAIEEIDPIPAASEIDKDAASSDVEAGAEPAEAQSGLNEHATGEPAVLKSALAGTGEAENTGKKGMADAGPVATPDPFEFANGSVASDPAEPWDEQSAAALVELYDSGETGLAPADVGVLPAAPEVGAADDTVAAEPVEGIDKAWLEARFADIAARVEMSLADIQPEASFAEFGRRFDQFEERIGSALADAAASQDNEGLTQIEAQLDELTRQLDQTQTQLTRLDNIEDQVGLVAAQLAESQIGSATEGGRSGDLDIQAIAETVGQKVASNFAYQQQDNDVSGQIGALQDILKAYIGERREGEQNTSEALDTMQSALVQLLDRVDAIEVQSASPAGDSAPAAAMQFVDQADAATTQQDLREAGRFKLDDAQPVEVGPVVELEVSETAADEDRNLAGAAAAGAASQAANRGPLPEPEAENGQARTSSLAANSAPQTDEALAAWSDSGRKAGSDGLPLDGASLNANPLVAQTASAAAPGDRAEFIAQARRAQQLAGERMKEAELLKAAAAKTGLTARISRRPGTSPAKSAGKGLPRPILMVAGVLAVVTIGTLAYGKIFGSSRPPAKVERQMLAPRPDAPQTSPTAAPGAMQPTAAPIDVKDAGGPVLTTPKPGGPVAAKPGGPAAAKPVKPVIKNRAQQSLLGGPDVDAGPADKFLSPSVPETVTGDLSMGETSPMFGEVLEGRPQILNDGEAEQRPRGVAIEKSGVLVPESALARIHENQQLARLSRGLSSGDGRGAAKISHATKQPASARATISSAPERARSSRLSMPPALIGPLSLRLAAAKGDPSAAFEVAVRFAEGKGIRQDFGAAAKWYQRSAARGFALAQYRLGTLYERGLGVKTDQARARIWYLRAAQQGNIKAMHNLAVLIAGNQGSSPDYATAINWFTKAAERGLTDSQFNLGILHGAGLGVPLDGVQSYKWFSLAAIGGDSQAARRADQHRGKLSQAQLAKAKRLVKRWRRTSVERLVNDPFTAGQAWLGHGFKKRAG